jgi:hypothetical protein
MGCLPWPCLGQADLPLWYCYKTSWISARLCVKPDRPSLAQQYTSLPSPLSRSLPQEEPTRMQFSLLGLSALAASLAPLAAGQGSSGTGQTTRYWDCCKPSCGWGMKTNSGKYIGTCDKSDNPLSGSDTRSGCDSGGSAYMCSNQSPWAVNDTLAYGWAAVKLAGSNEATWCCACYELTFTAAPLQGKKMIVQASNTGGDLGQNHFDLAVSVFNMLCLSSMSTIHVFPSIQLFWHVEIICHPTYI